MARSNSLATRFVKGAPCKRCGTSRRYSSTGACVACCRTPEYRKKRLVTSKAWHKRRPMYGQWWQARKRAARKGVPFEITEADIERLFVDTCPVLGLKLERGDATGRDTSPSVNRIVPELGYVLGNVEIISTRANRIISDGTIHEHELALEHMKRTVPREHWGYPPEPPRVVVTLTQSDLRSNPDRVGALLEQGCTVRIVSDADPSRVVMSISR